MESEPQLWFERWQGQQANAESGREQKLGASANLLQVAQLPIELPAPFFDKEG